MLSEQEKDIFRTISYFAFFDYPLTVLEIYKWQYEPESQISYSQILDQLSTSVFLKEKVKVKNGFYGLGKIEEQVKTRHIRFQNAVVKYKKLRRVMTYLVRLPHIRGIALCNSLPLHFTKETSDIDLFIIADEGRVWSTRLSAVLPMLILRQRPGEAKINPVDLSFFISESAFDFGKLKISLQDPYMDFWIKTLVPVYERSEGVFSQFLKVNSNVNLRLPKAKLARRPLRHRFKTRRKFMSPLSESMSRKLQMKKFPQDILDELNKDSRITVGDNILKFHKNDRREKVALSLQARMHV